MPDVLGLWRFFAGDSRIAPFGIAAALALTAVGVRLGWGVPAIASLFVGALIATLAAAAFER